MWQLIGQLIAPGLAMVAGMTVLVAGVMTADFGSLVA